MFKPFLRLLGMYAPFRNVRVAMYRKAGINIGKVSEFGSNIWLDINFKNMITIEDDVLLAGSDHVLSHSFLLNGICDEGFNPVIIKRGARIGANVLILAGVTIGEGSVIGAGALVVNDIPPRCLAVGVPAKPIKYFKEGFVNPTENMLFLKCKKCNIVFWSAVRCEKNKFKKIPFENNKHVCPNGHNMTYKKEDYYYKNSEDSL